MSKFDDRFIKTKQSTHLPLVGLRERPPLLRPLRSPSRLMVPTPATHTTATRQQHKQQLISTLQASR
jgi:hypothetical protein